MEYEQKYNAALERAAKLRIQNPFDTIGQMVEHIFPELKESESERIRKELITHFRNTRCTTEEGAEKISKWIAWLEKQGEPEDRESDDELTWLKTFIEEEAYYLSMDIRDEIDRKKLINLQNALAWLEKQHTDPYNGVCFDFYGHRWGMCARDNGIEIAMDGTPVRHFSYKDCEQTFGGKSALEAAKEEKVDNQNCIKPSDKVEPKFHPGDWVVLTAGELSITLQIVNVDTNKKLYWFNDDSCLPIVDEECLHLWTIQDAKDGDVLYSIDSKQPFIYKERPQFSQARGYCCINKFGEFAVWNTIKCVICTDKYIPATKEQRDTLFAKMEKLGYKWDSAKKELKMIGQNPVDKVEPKFHVGNWYQCTKDFFGKGVTFDKNTAYYCAQEGCLQDEYGCHIAIVKDLYDNFKLWEITDARDGDVLVDAYGNIGMFDKCYDFDWMSFCSLGNNGGFQYFTVEHENEKTHPATKEQRDLLFTKMEEEGYEYDNEKKELKKFEHKFNVDDWIVTDDSFGKIVRHVDEIRFNIIDKGYVVSDKNGLIYDISFGEEHKWHKWTIQDAEDGDLLAASDNSIFIYAGTDGSKAKFYIALTTFGTFNFEGGCWEDKDSVRPATEEEHKTFFEKMKDKRLEWDLKNKCIHYMAFC